MTTLPLALLLLLPSAQAHSPSSLAPRAAQSPTSTDTAPLTTGGLFWNFPVPTSLPWLALGDRGGQVLALTYASDLHLLSSFDTNPPSPIWTSPGSPMWTDVRAASESDVFLYCDVRTYSVLSSLGVLKKFRSSSAVPEWHFDFPEQLFSQPYFDLSRDGETIVSAFMNEPDCSVDLRVHDPATGAALRTIPIVVPGSPAHFDLSPDGTVVAASDGTGEWTTCVYDLESDVRFEVRGSNPSRQALSVGGSVLAVYEFTFPPPAGYFRILERRPGGYQVVLEVQTPFLYYPRDCAVSDDGSTVVATWSDTNIPRRAIVRAYDVATASMTMEHIDESGSPLVPTDVAISADGSVFVVGTWGIGSGDVAELAVYSRTSNQPIREHRLGGGVHSVDISPDGKRYAAVRTATNGGYDSAAIELYELGGEDFVVRGRPSVGETITFELYGAPGSRAVLLRSFALAPTPIDVPGVGTLHLDPGTLSSVSMGIVPPSGVATYSTVAATDPGMIGRTLWFQGLTSRPRHLTTDFVQLTILP